MSRRIWQRKTLVAIFSLFFVASLIGGCEDTPQDNLMQGRQALSTGQPDLAEEYLQTALEADPQLVEARRLIANVHMMRGEFEAAEQTLQTLWQEEQFDAEGELTAAQHSVRQVVHKQFSELYKEWAESIDYLENPDEFEHVVRAGLAHNSRDSHLNPLLVEFYQERAERLIERNDKIEAARVLERIDDLQAFPDIRRESRQQADRLRREAFAESARERFTREAQPDLVEAQAFDPETETVTMSTELDRRHNSVDDLEQARNMAVQTLLPMLGQLALTLQGAEDEEVDLAMLRVPMLVVTGENMGRNIYEMDVTVELEELIDMAFKYAESQRTSSEEPREAANQDQGAEIAVERDTIELDTSAVDDAE